MDFPSLEAETALKARGLSLVFGVDEAGRGCLAGPVTAAVLALPELPAGQRPPDGSAWAMVRDSKKIRQSAREALETKLQAEARAWGVGFASRAEIDRFNILEATALAVIRALDAALGQIRSREINFGTMTSPAFLVDGKLSLVGRGKKFVGMPEYREEFSRVRECFAAQEASEQSINEICLVGGDSKSVSIAAASVLAKVARDRWMLGCEGRIPGYEFGVHKGYFTARHRELLAKLGPSAEHRQSFAPVRNIILGRNSASS